MPRQLSDSEVLELYTDQPARMPDGVRARIEGAWRNGEAGPLIEAYALADLDPALEFADTWVALGAHEIAISSAASGENGDPAPELLRIERANVREVRVEHGLSCNVMRLVGEPDQPALAVLRYTQRQRRAMDHVVSLLEQALEGRRGARGLADDEYAQRLLRPIRDAQALFTPSRMAAIWRLLGYLAPYKRDLAFGMGAAVVITLVALVPPYLSGYLIDRVAGRTPAREIDAASLATIAWLAVSGIAGAYALRQLCVWIRLRLMAMIGEYVARDLRRDLYDHLQNLSVSFYSRMKTGSLITRVSNDTDRLWEFLAFGVIDVSLSLIMLLGLGGVLIYLDWRLGLIMVLPVPLVCWAIHAHGQRMQRMFLRAWRKWSRVTDHLSDTIPGMRVVKAFNQENRERGRFEHRNTDVMGEFNRIHEVWTTFWPLAMFGVHATVVSVWVFGVPRLLDGGSTWAGPPLSAGVFVSFLLYMTMFVQPIEILGQMARIMNRATSSAHRVFEVLDTQPEVVDKPDAVKLDPVVGHVAFEDVQFSYDGARRILRGISFEAHPGEMIGLVGPSGGGKSTLTTLIARFYDATSGSVKIDGVDVRDLDAGHYRQQIGMVLQDPYLFHGTVVDNLSYGRPEATLDEVVAAARAANAHDFICQLPHGYDTMVGERGHTLSGGERQRISIARAVLNDPRILILDEATSSVDTETERKIQDALDRLVAGRTVFAIAHRLSTLRRATRLLVIEDGEIVERGTHAELLELPDGLYKRLYNLQRELQSAV